MNRRRLILQTLLPLGVLLLGIGAFRAVMATQRSPDRQDRPPAAPLVEIHVARLEDRAAQIVAHGTVVPAQRITLQSEVSGRVVWLSAHLQPGGRVQADDTLVRVDARNYRTALEQQNASLNRAELDLEVERGRQVVAQREWQAFGQVAQTGSQEHSLALREPQIRTAEVGVKAARSARRRAQLDLARTTLKAPFNAFVQTESVDVGQLVTPQTPLATLVGTDRFWVQVSLPLDQVAWLDIPTVTAEQGSVTRVVHDNGATRIERSGEVVRLLGDLDPTGGMARVLVAVDHPFETDGAARDSQTSGDGDIVVANTATPRPEVRRELPLLLGAYVAVHLTGRPMRDVIELPRAALREGQRVLVVDADDRIESRPVHIVRERNADVLVKGGLTGGERVVISPLPDPVDGMKVRIASSPMGEAQARTGLGD